MEKEFEREVLDRLKAIEVKIDDYNKIRDKAEDAWVKSNQNEKDLNEIQEKIKWLTRTIAGAIISAVIGALIFFFFLM